MKLAALLKTISDGKAAGVLVIFLLLDSAILSQRALGNQEIGIRLTNKTHSFDVTEIEQSGLDVRLKLKNGYDKRIIDFQIALPRPLGKNGMVIDIIGDSKIIPPGDTYEYKFSLPASRLDPSNDLTQDREVVISTVLFDDLTSDGDIEAGAEMVAGRIGQKIQASRMLPLMLDVLNLSDRDLPAGLEELKTRVSSLSIKADGESEAIEILRSKYPTVSEKSKDDLVRKIGTGLYFGQGKLVVRIRDLVTKLAEKGTVSLRQELNTIRKEYEEMLAAP